MLSTLFISSAVICLLAGQAQALTVTNMTTFTSGPQGRRAWGATNTFMGQTIDQIGDFNGDGIGDWASGAGDGSEAFVVMGTSNPNAPDIDFVAARTDSSIQRITTAGFVSGPGDVNADGFDDLMLSQFYYEMPGRGGSVGRVVIVFGRAGPYTTISLASNVAITPSIGFTIVGSMVGANFGIGYSRGLGDINGDGIDDFAACGGYGTNGYTAVYAIYGKPASAPVVNYDSLTFNGSQGIRFDLQRNNFAFSFDNVGDFNGDGVDDFLFAAVGGAWLTYGLPSIPSSVTSGSGQWPFTSLVTFSGNSANGVEGAPARRAGDINGDGLADILIGGGFTSPLGRPRGGTVYVIYGTTTPLTGTKNLDSYCTGTQGYRVIGVGYSALGYSVSAAGDINQDGYADMLLGAPSENTYGTGDTYLLFGSPTVPTGNVIDLATYTDMWRFRAPSVQAQLGFQVAGGSDLNGDGIPDISMSAWRASVGPSGGAAVVKSGAVYHVYGPLNALPTAAPTPPPSVSPTAIPSVRPSAAPSLVPTASPTVVCVQWVLGDVGQTCLDTCSAVSRECKAQYFEDALTAETFYDMVSGAVDVRSGGYVGAAAAYCNGGVNTWPGQGAPLAVAALIRQPGGGNILRRFCSYPTSPAEIALGCDEAVGLGGRRFCPCVSGTCDVTPWYLGGSSESCTAACARVGRVCDAEVVNSIADVETFNAMVDEATSIDTDSVVGSASCLGTNAPAFATLPAIVTVNVPGNQNQTFCSFPTAVTPVENACDAELSFLPAQRFCPCKYGPGRRLAEEEQQVQAVAVKSEKETVTAVPFLRGARV